MRKLVVLLAAFMALSSASVYSGTFFDDFEAENDFWVVGMGEWKIENGLYHQTDTTSNGARGLFSYPEGSETWGNDFTIEAKVIIYQSGIETHLEAGVMYKWADQSNQYHVVLDQNNAIVRINKCAGGSWPGISRACCIPAAGDLARITQLIFSPGYNAYTTPPITADSRLMLYHSRASATALGPATPNWPKTR